MDNETVDNNETVGKRIKKWRKLKKMTQEQLARKIEMNVKSIQRYETDTNPIPIDVLNNIAIALNIGIDKLICEENTQDTSNIKLTDIEDIYYEVREINSSFTVGGNINNSSASLLYFSCKRLAKNFIGHSEYIICISFKLLKLIFFPITIFSFS